MTYEAIEKRRDELEAKMNELGYTDDLMAEWKALTDAEMSLAMENAIAVGRNGIVTIFITSAYECGWAINTKVNGEWNYDESCSICDALKQFADFARENKIKTVLIRPEYLDLEGLKKLDRDFMAYRAQEEYADACMASAYGDDSLMERYNRSHGIEKEYSPSNPWDAPGMSIRDFI